MRVAPPFAVSRLWLDRDVGAERAHRLDRDDRAPGLVLQADPTRLTQIIANLLNNAAKYTPPGRGIDLRAEVLVVGMGKLGGGELNVSSDIDLIVLYDDAAYAPEDQHEVEVHGEELIILRERDVHAVAAERIE